MKKLIFLISLLFTSFLFAQNKIVYNGSGNYTLRERTDLRRYENGKYIGLVSREVTSFITPVSYEDGYLYEGSFFLQQDTMHARQSVGFGLRDPIPSSFKINSDGNLKMIEDHGYPSFRSFPTYPEKTITKGDSWTGKAERAVDPLNKGVVTKMPIYVQYTYIGDEFYHDEPVFLISAQWATRYGMGSGTSYIDWGGDKDLQKATGSHKANIYVSKITGNCIVVRDNVDETYWYTDGSVIQFKGTIALFTEYPPTYDKSDLIPALKRICELDEEQSQKLDNLIENSSKVAMADTNSVTSELVHDDLIQTSVKSEITPEQISNSEIENDIESFSSKIEKVTQSISTTNTNNIELSTTPAGIKLSIQNLQFKPDSSELLPGESARLNQIAEVLKTVPDAQLLVEGHTADTGNPAGEMQLSIERAQAIANALIQRGIKAERFICKGFGAKKPIADKNDKLNMAKNRRVEITILD